MAEQPPHGAPAAWILTPADPATLEIWGMAPEERLRRSLVRAGCAPVRTLAPGQRTAPAEAGAGSALLVRADWIFDERLIAALAGAGDCVLLAPGAAGEPVAARAPAARLPELAALLRGEARGRGPGLRELRPAELVPAWNAKLRKAEPPYLIAAREADAAAIEERTFASAYKGATDLVTKWLWPAPARAVTRRLARARVHPNSVTIASWGLAVAVCWLFARGSFGAGLAVAWLMTFLDTVDGKLARVTLTSSRLGDVLDHGLDLLHPPFWWWAWGVGLGAAGSLPTLVVVGGYFAGRALEGVFLARFGLEIHSWRPIDTLFRTITARRNPNLLLLSVGALSARPDLGLVLVALWTLASLGFHGLRVLKALRRARRGEPVEPWDRAAAPAAR
jgi:phosphatidylglycerophosphate synthase